MHRGQAGAPRGEADLAATAEGRHEDGLAAGVTVEGGNDLWRPIPKKKIVLKIVLKTVLRSNFDSVTCANY